MRKLMGLVAILCIGVAVPRLVSEQPARPATATNEPLAHRQRESRQRARRTRDGERDRRDAQRQDRLDRLRPPLRPASGRSTCRGKYVLPGLIDAHTHAADFASFRRALESGVTTVRSAGVSYYADVGYHELVKAGAVVGPDVVTAGYHVRPQIAQEAFLSDPVVRGPDERRHHDRQDAARGADEPVPRRELDQDSGDRARGHRRHRSAEAGLHRRRDPRDRAGGGDQKRARSRRTRTATKARWRPSRPACAASSTARICRTRRCRR